MSNFSLHMLSLTCKLRMSCVKRVVLALLKSKYKHADFLSKQLIATGLVRLARLVFSRIEITALRRE